MRLACGSSDIALEVYISDGVTSDELCLRLEETRGTNVQGELLHFTLFFVHNLNPSQI